MKGSGAGLDAAVADRQAVIRGSWRRTVFNRLEIKTKKAKPNDQKAKTWAKSEKEADFPDPRPAGTITKNRNQPARDHLASISTRPAAIPTPQRIGLQIEPYQRRPKVQCQQKNAVLQRCMAHAFTLTRSNRNPGADWPGRGRGDRDRHRIKLSGSRGSQPRCSGLASKPWAADRGPVGQQAGRPPPGRTDPGARGPIGEGTALA